MSRLVSLVSRSWPRNAAINAFMLGCEVNPAIDDSAVSTMCTPLSIAAM